MTLGGTGEQLIASAYTFGSSALGFATLPFLFIILRGALKANDHNTRTSSVFSVILFAFIVHTVSCVSFMTLLYILDTQALYGQRYFTEKVMTVFWTATSGKDAVLAAAGASDTVEASGAWVILDMVITVTKLANLFLPLIVLSLGGYYGFLQSKKDVYRNDHLYTIYWTAISSIGAMFLYYLWAKIASLALFIPTTEYGGDFVLMSFHQWRTLLGL